MKVICVVAKDYLDKPNSEYYFPLGFGYLAAYIKKAGHKCVLFNGSSTDAEYLHNYVKKEDYDVLMVSMSTSNRLEGKVLCKIAKKKGAWTVLGGPYPSKVGKQIFKENHFTDIVIKDFPGRSIVRLLNSLQKKDFAKIKLIPNVIFKNNSKIFETMDKTIKVNLNMLPVPAYDLIGNDLTSVNKMTFPIETSRGCPLGCKFCSITTYFYGYQKKDPKKVVQEIKLIQKKYQYNKKVKRDITIHFIDPTINFDKKHIIDVCKEIIKEELNIKFHCEGRLDMMDEEILDYLAKAGCKDIYYGVQSGSENIRKSMGIYYSNDTIYKAVKMTKEKGINMILYWIVGYPGETYKDLFKTVYHSFKLGQENLCNLTHLFPGIELTNNLIKAKEFDNKMFQNNINMYYYKSQIPEIFLKFIRLLIMSFGKNIFELISFVKESISASIHLRLYMFKNKKLSQVN